jgi:DNA mismatch endonuclease (patch repair protein)
VAFPGAKLAVFIDGCFWHGCPIHGSSPTTNAAWWAVKLSNNEARDRDTDRLLQESGWRVARFWEHEDPDTVARAVIELLRTTDERVR